MDARVRTGAAAYDAPAGTCPPAGPPPGAQGGFRPAASSAAGASAAAPGSSARGGAARPAPTVGMSESMGTVGMSDDNGDRHSPAEAFSGLGEKLGELKEFAGYYLAAKSDAFKITLRNLGVYAALGIVGLIAGSAIITTAAVLLLVGIAWGLGDLLWDQYWLGALLVGLLVLGGIAGGIIFGMKRLTNTSRKRTVEKYENRQRDQRIYFGEDVRGRRAGH